MRQSLLLVGMRGGERRIFATSACPGERGSGPSRARTSHRPYSATLNPLAKLVQSRGDGLSSPWSPCKNRPCWRKVFRAEEEHVILLLLCSAPSDEPFGTKKDLCR